MATLTLGGRNLDRLRAESGQFFLLRPLRPRLWWQAHPISLSAAPTSAGLSFTIKDRGDFTSSLLTLPVGTRIVVEGPYGVVTPDVAEGRPLLFVVGGVGVAPARSFLQSLGPRTQPVVLYRARLHEDLVHLDELRSLAAERGGKVLTLVGRTAALAARDPFGPAALRVAVPDLRHRTAIVCGPDSLCHAARSGLKAAGMPEDQIHAEVSWW